MKNTLFSFYLLGTAFTMMILAVLKVLPSDVGMFGAFCFLIATKLFDSAVHDVEPAPAVDDSP